MTRPSRNMDQKLLEAGKAIIMEDGISGLQLRRVAERADVNLAMIYYHFKDKQDFIQKLLEKIYEEFFKEFSLEMETESDPEKRLRKAWQVIAQHVRTHRRLILAILRDVLNNEVEIIPFLEKNFSRHINYLVKSVKACKKQGTLAKAPLPLLIMFMGLNMVGPNIVLTILEQTKFNATFEIIKKAAIPLLLSDRMIDERLDLVFKALAPEK
jgi:AcrR family transcriptional regulator